MNYHFQFDFLGRNRKITCTPTNEVKRTDWPSCCERRRNENDFFFSLFWSPSIVRIECSKSSLWKLEWCTSQTKAVDESQNQMWHMIRPRTFSGWWWKYGWYSQLIERRKAWDEMLCENVLICLFKKYVNSQKFLRKIA